MWTWFVVQVSVCGGDGGVCAEFVFFFQMIMRKGKRMHRTYGVRDGQKGIKERESF